MTNKSRRNILGGLVAGLAMAATGAVGKSKDEYDILIERYNAALALPGRSDNLSYNDAEAAAALPTIEALFDHMLTAFPIPMGDFVPPSTIRTANGDNDLTLVREMLRKPSIDVTDKQLLMSLPRWMITMTVTKAVICNKVRYIPRSEGFKRFCSEGGALYILN